MREKTSVDLLPPKQRHTELKGIITKETITSIGEQPRTCRIFVSDMVIRSISVGARIRKGGKFYVISNGILRQTTVDDAGNKDRPTTEYMAADQLVTRWKKAAKQNIET